MKLEVELWEMLNGKATKIKYGDTIFSSDDFSLLKPKIRRSRSRNYTVDEDKFMLKNWNNMNILEIAKKINRSYESVKSRHKLINRYLDMNEIPNNWPMEESHLFTVDKDKNEEEKEWKESHIIEPKIVRLRRKRKYEFDRNVKPLDKGKILTVVSTMPICHNILNDVLEVMHCHGWKNRDVRDVLKRYYPNNKVNTLETKACVYKRYIKKKNK